MSLIRKALFNFSKFFAEPPKVMGRWTIVYCPEAIKTKVDRTNEDHCGPCAQYDIQVPRSTSKVNETKGNKPLQ